MTDEPKKPKRRHVLKLELDADSLRELESGVYQFATQIGLGYLSTSGVSGGCSYSWIYSHEETPGQTPEGYRADLERWLDWDRAQRKEPAS